MTAVLIVLERSLEQLRRARRVPREPVLDAA